MKALPEITNSRWFMLIAVLCLLLAACAPKPLTTTSPYDVPLPEFSIPVTPEEIHLAYYKYSPVAIVKALHQNDAKNWNLIMDKIMEGDRTWIWCGARYLYPGTDAGATTELTVALAHALRANPEAVLYTESFEPNISLLNICSLPFIEPEYEFIKDYGEKTLAGLRQTDAGGLSLQDSKATCIRRLEKALEHADQVYREGRWNW